MTQRHNAKQSCAWSTEGDLNSLAQDFNGTANDVSFTDTFNPAHQLATATITNPAFKFVIGASGTDSYGAVNVLNQYPAVTPAGSGTQTIAYDNNGNLTGDGTWTFAYDPENRLMTANKTGTAAAYAYDPLDRRTKKTVNSTSTYFLQDGDDEVGEYTAAGAIQRRFVLGDTIDEPIAMIDYTIAGNPKTYFHTDKQGSTIAMSNSSGNLTEGPFKYDGYGNGAPTTGVPFKYTGRRLDPETGLYFYRARYYSAALGRFLQTDPVGYDDDLVLYKYAANDPINTFDPTGMSIGPDGVETVTVSASRMSDGLSGGENAELEAIANLVIQIATAVASPMDANSYQLAANKTNNVCTTAPTAAVAICGIAGIAACGASGGTGCIPVAIGQGFCTAAVGAAVAGCVGSKILQNKRHTPAQQETVKEAKDAKKAGDRGKPISDAEADALLDKAGKSGLPTRDDRAPDKAAHWVGGKHIHIGPVGHIKVQ